MYAPHVYHPPLPNPPVTFLETPRLAAYNPSSHFQPIAHQEDQLNYESEQQPRSDYQQSYLRAAPIGDCNQAEINSNRQIGARHTDSGHSIARRETDVNGPISRQVRVFVTTVRDREGGNMSNTYEDNISQCNLNQRCRKMGVPAPRGYWTQVWMVRDCGGWTGAMFTWFLILGGESLVMLILLSHPLTVFTMANIVFSLVTAGLGTVAHLRAMFSDPGAVPRGNATEENISRMGLRDGQTIYRCPKCDCIKPDRAHHCSVCRRCIRKMDHHCPWINNCVGEANQKFFVLFTMYISVISWHALAIAVCTLVICSMDSFLGVGTDSIFRGGVGTAFPRVPTHFNHWTYLYTRLSKVLGCWWGPTTMLILLILLMLEGLMFGLFTAIMCGTQLCSICSDETNIEQLKRQRAEHRRYERRSWCSNMRIVCGHPFSFRWFSPFHDPPLHIAPPPTVIDCFTA